MKQRGKYKLKQITHVILLKANFSRQNVCIIILSNIFSKGYSKLSSYIRCPNTVEGVCQLDTSVQKYKEEETDNIKVRYRLMTSKLHWNIVIKQQRYKMDLTSHTCQK